MTLLVLHKYIASLVLQWQGSFSYLLLNGVRFLEFLVELSSWSDSFLEEARAAEVESAAEQDGVCLTRIHARVRGTI